MGPDFLFMTPIFSTYKRGLVSERPSVLQCLRVVVGRADVFPNEVPNRLQPHGSDGQLR